MVISKKSCHDWIQNMLYYHYHWLTVHLFTPPFSACLKYSDGSIWETLRRVLNVFESSGIYKPVDMSQLHSTLCKVHFITHYSLPFYMPVSVCLPQSKFKRKGTTTILWSSYLLQINQYPKYKQSSPQWSGRLCLCSLLFESKCAHTWHTVCVWPCILSIFY